MGHIDDLIQGIGKELTNIQAAVQTRTQKMLKAYNLGQELRELEQQKTDQLVSIGRLICDKYERQINVSDESLQEQCKEISSLDKDIVHLQKQLDSLKMQSNPK